MTTYEIKLALSLSNAEVKELLITLLNYNSSTGPTPLSFKDHKWFRNHNANTFIGDSIENALIKILPDLQQGV